MGWPPAVIIVVRHGARLDAADKQWHLTSPTPYDPPLTYGGWMQSRLLGARIASILRTREDEEYEARRKDHESVLGEGLFKAKRRRHKVIIHSSPFLRCVQTSVAISSGLAQHPSERPSSTRNSLAPEHASTSSYANLVQSIPALSIGPPAMAKTESAAAKNAGHDAEALAQPPTERIMLRVDAFLGEWLTPDYFELITPPPSSVMMVASAKADLLRREDYSNLTEFRGSPTATQGFPGGWSPMTAPVGHMDAKGKPRSTFPTSQPSKAGHAPPHETESTRSSRHSAGAGPVQYGAYRPPVPSYAISASDPIPPGYVSHARDVCVDVDYQWDSMRQPHDWGDGGQYGEEWSKMHDRFRHGLNGMLHWYRDHENPAKPATRRPSAVGLGVEEQAMDYDDDGHTDLVLVLVTHGAGCNALIGALTNQPALLDVGMASLTMAVRKDERGALSSPCGSPRSHFKFPLHSMKPHEDYDVQMVASQDHLRQSPAGSVQGRPNSQHRSVGSGSIWRRHGSNAARSSPDAAGRTPSMSIIANYSSVRRTASTSSSNPFTTRRPNSKGLWTARRSLEQEMGDDDASGDDMLLNFGDSVSASIGTLDVVATTAAVAAPDSQKEENEAVAPLGLWGSAKTITFDQNQHMFPRGRDTTPKRRWTITDQTSGVTP